MRTASNRLYYDYYKHKDHADLASFIESEMTNCFWLVSYDNVAAVRKLYPNIRNIIYDVGYTARGNRLGREVMFFSPKLSTVPDLVGPVKMVRSVLQIPAQGLRKRQAL